MSHYRKGTNTRNRREEKRAAAEKRQAAYAGLSPVKKLERLDLMGFTASRERARIAGIK